MHMIVHALQAFTEMYITFSSGTEEFQHSQWVCILYGNLVCTLQKMFLINFSEGNTSNSEFNILHNYSFKNFWGREILA